MKKFSFCILLIVILFTCGCAYSQYGLNRGQWYFKQQHPGNIMVDDNGQPVNGIDTLEFICVEIKGPDEPIIEKVIHNGKSYAASVFYVAPSEFQIGIRKLDGRKEILKPKEGNKIWKLELTLLENNTATLKEDGHTIITGKLAGHSFTWRIKQKIELATDENY